MNQDMKKNKEFYKNCTQYFEYLRKNSSVDFEFEDEYYFTMPAISSHQ
jgi:hypothetical protein